MAKKAMKSKDLLAITAKKKKESVKSVKKESKIAQAKATTSKKFEKVATVTKTILEEIYERPTLKHVAFEDISLKTSNSRFFKFNNGTGLALFSNTSKETENALPQETGSLIEVKRPNFHIKFNKLEKETDVLELAATNSKIKLEFKDLTPNKKRPVHRPLSIKDSNTIFWKNVDEKTNITFDVHPNRLVQNIIVTKKANKYEYAYLLNTENLSLVQGEKRDAIQLTDGGADLFTLVAPVLKDFSGKKIAPQYFDVKETNPHQVQVSFTFNAEEVNANSRFPIEISPEIISEKAPIVKYQQFSRTSETEKWEAGLTASTAKFSDRKALEKNVVTISKDLVDSLQGKKISKVSIKLQSDSREAILAGDRPVRIPEGGGFLDITKEFLNANGKDIEIDLKPFPVQDRPSLGYIDEHLEIPFLPANPPDINHIEIPGAFTPLPGSISIPDETDSSDIVVEYFIDDEMMPASESYTFAGGVEGCVTLDSGDMTASFSDISFIKTSLPFKISHTYKWSSENFDCGRNWRLNLHQSLVKGSVENNGSDYIYTDGNGFKHGFIETYYYFNAAGEKVPVEKENVNFDIVTETMWTDVSGKKCEVFKEQSTSSGMKLTTRLDGFNGIKYYEQRQKEEKQLEETLATYKRNLREFVIVQSNSGTEIQSLSALFKDEKLSAGQFDSFMNSAAGHLVMQKQEAMQLSSLYTQKNYYNTQLKNNEIQRRLYDKDSTTSSKHNLMMQNRSLNLQYNSLTTQLDDLLNVWKEDKNADLSYNESKGPSESYIMYKKMTDLYWQFKNLNKESPNTFKMPYVFSRFFLSKDKKQVFYYYGDKYNNERSPFDFSTAAKLADNCLLDKDLVYLNFKTTPSFDYKQISLLSEQVKNINQQEEDQATQKSLIDDKPIQEQLDQIIKQIDYLVEKNSTRIAELQRIYKEYFNYEADLVKLKKTMAVACLSSEGQSLCFNEYGQLCALTDSYDNSINIEYDINNRISCLSDGKNSINFNYDFYGLLTSIVDYNGNRVEYTYSGNGTGSTLQSVKLANGDTVTFNYTNNKLTAISSDHDKTKTKLEYGTATSENASAPLQTITNYSLVSQIKDDDVVTTSDSVAFKNNVFAKVLFEYGIHECTITNDNKKKRYFMDDHGCAIGGYGQKEDGSFGAYSYAYADRENNEMFSIHEIDDSIIVSQNKAQFTIQASTLPSHQKEFMFTALISAKKGFQASTNLVQENNTVAIEGSLWQKPHLVGHLENHFTGEFKYNNLTGNTIFTRSKTDVFIGLKATVTYKDKSTCSFQTPIIDRQSGVQLCAVPVSLDISKDVSKIELAMVNPSTTIYQCQEFRFAPAEIEYKKFDAFKKLVSSETGNEFVCTIPNGNHYRKTETTYKYNELHLPIEKRAVCTDNMTNGASPTKVTLVSKYAYDGKGAQIREESYIEGNQATQGSMVDENLYDDKGRILKNQVYNSLESSSRKFVEKGYHEKDSSVEYEMDALGEVKVTYEYDPTTNEVLSTTAPSGSKFTYSRDCNSHAVTGISQSTEEGESNFVETHYNCGLVTKLTSGTHTITYEYNAKREKTAVFFDGLKKADYKYDKTSKPLKAQKIRDVNFEEVYTETTTTTLWDSQNKKSTTEAFTDSKKNLIQIALDGNILFRNSYSKTNDLICSADFITGTITSADYDSNNNRLNSIAKSKAEKEEFGYLKSVQETYKYDDNGKMTEHAALVNGKEIQKYKFEYNTNVAKTLKAIKLPNGLTYIPQKDLLGRDIGKTLLNANGEKILGEYISFRKVGNHTSDMVSSVRYGEIHNGTFGISEGIRYKYDSCGNITEKWVNGKFAAAYAYDHLNRIIREDNATFKKTWLFSYDNGGNRTSKIELPLTRKNTGELIDYTEANVENYSYDGDKLISCNDNAFAYDGFGDPTLFKNKKLVWKEGKLKQFGSLTYDYDGYGKRIRKGSTYFTYDTNKDLLQMETKEKVLEFIYDDKGLSGLKYQGIQYVLRQNPQGDITHIFTLNGKLEARYEYDAWGNHKILDENGNEITDQDHIGNVNPFRYRGYFYDIETNLYYLINRYYDPETGRFISQDQISYLQPEVINGLNLFAYCGNNPVMRIDDDGRSWKSFWNGVKKFFKGVGNFFKKVGLYIAGRIIAGIGFLIVAIAAVLSLGCTLGQLAGINLFSTIGNLCTGVLYQIGMTIGMYGGFMMASAFSDDIFSDMESINWNPFNTDEEKALDSTKVSFFKGIPIIRSDAGRSGNVGFILLKHMDAKNPDGSTWIDGHGMTRNDVLRHEFGHHFQLAILGPINYFISVGIPSAGKWGSSNYYDNPWENMANEKGGAQSYDINNLNNLIPINHNGNSKHLLMATFLGPYSLIYSAIL